MKNTHKIIFLSIIIIGLMIGGYFWSLRKPHLLLSKTSFTQLTAWRRDTQIATLAAFKHSCEAIAKRNPSENFSALPQSGRVITWQKICAAAQTVPANDNAKAQQFFETWFVPYHVSNLLRARGLFTGYYLPLIHGSLQPDKRFNVPVYAPPDDLVKIQLGLFRPELAGTTLIAQQINHQLLPYPDRAAINQGAISKTSRVLLWSDNVLDVFFAQIQGSAKVELPDQQKVLIHYAGTNGRAYTAIGRILIAKNALPPQNISMQTIREWLTQHPDQMDGVLNQNAAYVFFNLLNNAEPNGSENVMLTPACSLAVDTHIMPLGAPIWLETSVPLPRAPAKSFHHLLITQDTGGAIHGVVRGDIYWGSGDMAAYIAGHMQSSGEYWILLPKE